MLNVCVYISHTPKPFLSSPKLEIANLEILMTKRGRFKMLSPNVHITGSFLANFSLLIIKVKKNYHSIDNHGFNQCLEKFSFELKFKIFFKINSFLTISTAYREMLFIIGIKCLLCHFSILLKLV